MIKKRGLYYPAEAFKKKAWVKDNKLYQEGEKDQVKFWEKRAQELFWFKKWEKGFVHKPPYFHWFWGGKINITANIFKELSDKPALIWEPEPIEEKAKVLTYRELFREVCQCANYLKKLGVKKGDRVGIYLPMIPEIVVVMLACARIGAVHSVVFSAFSSIALNIRLKDTSAKVLVTAETYFRRGKLMDLKKNAKDAVIGTQVKETIILKRNGISPWHNEKDFCEAEVMSAEDLFFILYTSGSTGKPKGVMHTCGGYAVQAKFTGKWIFDFHQNDVFWCTSDPGWVTGHTYTIYSPLLNGVTTLMFEGAPDFPKPDRWAKIIEKHKVTIFYTAPTAIRMFEKYGKDHIKDYKFRSLRLLGSVGEPIDESAWQWFFENIGKSKCPIVDTWWQTETGGILITSLPGLGPFKPAFTGLPLPGINIDILNKEGKTAKVNEEGSLVIKPPFSPSLLRGVYNNEKKYLSTYWSEYGNKIYFTSDGALKDENGLIRIVGRIDDVIKIAGHRLTTGELEAAVNLHPDITECAVVGVPDEIKGEVPVAFIISKTNKTEAVLAEEVINQIRKEIGPIARPKKIYLVGDLPKTRSGKIMRRILRKLFTGEELGDLSTLANQDVVDKLKKIINEPV
ncbi:MAG: acetate--CoA ligase [Candidatus Nealsonbacteria bacterium]